ncbi:hypothetical protein CRE_29342 [Caenorhabditis remanei]|uniref:F-box domain-containing protein n=1 Tax=Caenorhabditis remanei TaxID=31234 RepID=E3MXZ9_CAERE|nr:hypothetical protein CRE_29342 [Caenorhabditis remanei]
MTSSFPLLNLPPEAILHVLKSMDYGEIVILSLLSERAKQSVESVNLYSRGSSAVLSDLFRLIMNFDKKQVELTFTMDEIRENRTNDFSSVPKNIELITYNNTAETVELCIKGLNLRKWINHLKAIFHFSELYCLQFDENASLFDIKELRTMFNSYYQLCILSDNGSDVKSILENIPTRRLFFENDVFNRLENPYQVLIQNYDELAIGPELESPNSLELDDLLMTNSKAIKIFDSNWAEKELNRFLKHWMKGSNPRMERLSIYFFPQETLNNSKILKGIKGMEVPVEHMRWFKSYDEVVEPVTGGYDFYRCDGTKATIAIRAHDLNMVEMYVWYPHCVGEAEEMGN